jgi:hypothetical protein
MKPSLAPNLVLNLSSPCAFFFGSLNAPSINHWCCYAAINVFEPLRAFNPQSQNFTPLFNKISWLCRYKSGEDARSNDGCNSGLTGHDFTENSSVYRQAIWVPWADVQIAADYIIWQEQLCFKSIRLIDGRDISIKVIGRLLSVCFQSFFHLVNCVSFNSVRPLC